MIVCHADVITRAHARVRSQISDYRVALDACFGLDFLSIYCERGDRSYVRASCRDERAIVADAAREIAEINEIEH